MQSNYLHLQVLLQGRASDIEILITSRGEYGPELKHRDTCMKDLLLNNNSHSGALLFPLVYNYYPLYCNLCVGVVQDPYATSLGVHNATVLHLA